MDGTVTVEQVIYELLFPLFTLAGVIVRVVGALGIGLVAGSVLRRSMQMQPAGRLHIPVTLLAVAVLAGVAAWSSPGTLAMFGVGVFIAYMFMDRRRPPEVVEAEVVEVREDMDEVADEAL